MKHPERPASTALAGRSAFWHDLSPSAGARWLIGTHLEEPTVSTTYRNPYRAQPGMVEYLAPCGRCRTATLVTAAPAVLLHDETLCPLTPAGEYVQAGDLGVHLAPLCPACHAAILAADNGPVTWPRARFDVTAT